VRFELTRPFRSVRLWYAEEGAISNAVGYAMRRSRSHDAVIRVYDEAGDVIDRHTQAPTISKGRVLNFV
jgi:hypothetical protein